MRRHGIMPSWPSSFPRQSRTALSYGPSLLRVAPWSARPGPRPPRSSPWCARCERPARTRRRSGASRRRGVRASFPPPSTSRSTTQRRSGPCVRRTLRSSTPSLRSWRRPTSSTRRTRPSISCCLRPSGAPAPNCGPSGVRGHPLHDFPVFATPDGDCLAGRAICGRPRIPDHVPPATGAATDSGARCPDCEALRLFDGPFPAEEVVAQTASPAPVPAPIAAPAPEPVAAPAPAPSSSPAPVEPAAPSAPEPAPESAAGRALAPPARRTPGAPPARRPPPAGGVGAPSPAGSSWTGHPAIALIKLVLGLAIVAVVALFVAVEMYGGWDHFRKVFG